MSWLLPPHASSYAGDIDWLYYLILIITGLAFFIVEIGLIWFIIKYRARPGSKALYHHGFAKAEWIWTTVTAVVVVVIGLLSAGVWDRIKGRDSVPANATPIGIHAKQFEWLIRYPGADGQLGSGDDMEIRNQLHLEVNKPVVAELTSEDAIHSFFIPAFRIKQDAVPGMKIRVWFQPTDTGTFELACAELCGLGHYRMRAVATVHPEGQLQRRLDERGRAAAASPTALNQP
jgi:cytochrome c oxidase subunit II